HKLHDQHSLENKRLLESKLHDFHYSIFLWEFLFAFLSTSFILTNYFLTIHILANWLYNCMYLSRITSTFKAIMFIISIGLQTNICDKEDLFNGRRSEEHTSELQSRFDLVCRLLLEKKKKTKNQKIKN